MTREDLLLAIGSVEDSRLARCEKNRIPSMVIHEEDSKMKNGGNYSKKTSQNGMPKVWLIAAIIAVMVFMMGCAWVIHLTIAAHPDYPVTDAASISDDRIHVSVSDVTKTDMHVYVAIEGFEPGSEMAVYMLQSGPFVLEKRTDSGWEKLPVLVDDPEWDADKVWTDGNSDWIVNWSAIYGVLDSGTYRYTINLLEGHDPVSAEFTIGSELDTDLTGHLESILNADSYCVKYTIRNEFGSLENLSRDERELIENENAVWVHEYWRSGEDLMNLIYREDVLWVGMMYKDGIKYTLDHEGDDRTKPIIGWSPWPDMDMNRLTDWISMLTVDTDSWEAEYDAAGALTRLERRSHTGRYDDYDVEVTYIETWEFKTDNRSETAEKFAAQGVDTAQGFSWEEDQKNMKSLDVEYSNTTALPIHTASQAIERAKAECTVQYDKIIVYRDEEAGMWKVEFQILYGYQGYRYIYLNDDGITQMVSGAGSKVPEWQDMYPGP